ncbi:endonuclease domain-containing protein [Sphingosinicella terrae]|uniref:endonuclease domain-containing protein n=1 Tax=Sphingosinicella terrae TaxID=2172047 RepID=UPI000E0DC835|nr:DUF559 domain-containing protein [Sphingosinicella terrae]
MMVKYRPPEGSTARARGLRSIPTEAEKAMWNLLRANFRDMHFRRQAPIRRFFADFVSHRARLVIEVDGGQHGGEKDRRRTRTINGQGYRVVRFWNSDVLGNDDGVAIAIAETLQERHPTHPSPSRGGLNKGVP